LPLSRRRIGHYLASNHRTREFASAAVIELVACSAIRAGSEDYRRLHGTRGAVTLLKSNLSIYGQALILKFRSKGGMTVSKEVNGPRLVRVVRLLGQLPGRRLFQYRAENGTVHKLTAREVNAFLREISGTNISLKDFRTLLASASVLECLARMKPATSSRLRRKQVLQAVSATADELANTPAICRKSYVHDAVINALRARRAGTLLARAQKWSVAESAGQGVGAGHRVRRHLLRKSAVNAARSATVPLGGLCGIAWLLRGPRNFFPRTWFTTSNLSLYERISHGDTQQRPNCRRRCPGQGTRSRRGCERRSRQRRGCY
jgi:hypothetical protein